MHFQRRKVIKETIKEVKKAWGRELIIVNCDKYCGKLLYLDRGAESSYHKHINKQETFFCLEGQAALIIEGKDYMLNPYSRLILAASGTESLEPFIRQVAGRANFVLLGRVANVSEVYNACSVAVFPSVTEGFGIGILEAMAYGRPVIASEGARASDLVDDSFGFVVPIRSPEAIAERINLMKSMPHYDLMEMGQKARKKAKNYTWSKVREKYKEVFLEMMNNESNIE